MKTIPFSCLHLFAFAGSSILAPATIGEVHYGKLPRGTIRTRASASSGYSSNGSLSTQ